MFLIVFGCVDAPHRTVKTLRLDGRVGGDVQLFCALFFRPLGSGEEQGFSDAVSAHILRHMKRGQVSVAVLAAEKSALCRYESLELSI